MYIPIGITTFIIIIISLWVLISNIFQRGWRFGKNNGEPEYIEMENVFFDEVEKGEKPFRFLDIFDQFDLMFLKSLFQSEQIPYEVDFQYGSKLYPGLNMVFNILERDYNDALQIVNSFDRRKNKNIRVYSLAPDDTTSLQDGVTKSLDTQ